MFLLRIVELLCENIRNETDNVVQLLKCELAVLLTQIPQEIQDLSVAEFKNKYNQDNAVFLEQSIQNEKDSFEKIIKQLVSSRNIPQPSTTSHSRFSQLATPTSSFLPKTNPPQSDSYPKYSYNTTTPMKSIQQIGINSFSTPMKTPNLVQSSASLSSKKLFK